MLCMSTVIAAAAAEAEVVEEEAVAEEELSLFSLSYTSPRNEFIN